MNNTSINNELPISDASTASMPITFAGPSTPLRVVTYSYNQESVELINEIPDLSNLSSYIKSDKNLWVIVTGKIDAVSVQAIFQSLSIDSKSEARLLDPENTLPRLHFRSPSLLELNQILYFENNGVIQRQANFYLRPQLLLLFLPDPSEILDESILALNDKASSARHFGVDVLAYHIFQSIMRTYISKVLRDGKGVNLREAELIENPDTFSMKSYLQLRGALVVLKRQLWFQRNILLELNAIQASSSLSTIILPQHIALFQQCPEQLSEMIELLDGYIDHCANLLNIYFSLTSNETNQVMKTLTIFSVIFLPLSFLAGLWGMNFDYAVSHLNMPELHWKYGYIFAWSMMLLIAFGLLGIFWKLRWVGFSKKRN